MASASSEFCRASIDRVVIRGTVPSVCHAQAMATLLDSRGIRLFHYAKQFAEPLREAIRRHVEQVAAREGIEVEYIKSRRALAKKDRIAEILAQRDTHPVANCFAATVPLFVKCSHAVKSTFTPARSGVRFRKSFEYLRTISRAADSR